MKGKVCGDFCEFTLDKGHFITGVAIETKTKRLERGNPFCSLPHIYNPMQLSGLAFLWI
jgi:hypothetical protein